MKMTQHDFACLSHAVTCVFEELGGEKFAQKYRDNDFPRADKCKDKNMRFRWDLLWSVPVDIRQPLMNRLYTYLNDTHIDTALKKIVPSL